MIAGRASDEEDRRREEALNGLLVIAVAVAVFEAAIRLPAVLGGGAGAGDHRTTLVVSLIAAACFVALLVLSRSGRQVWATVGLLWVIYVLITWLFATEGTEEPVAVILCPLLVVTASVLLNPRVSLLSVVAVTATLVTVAAAGSSTGDELGVGEQIGVGAILAALSLVVSARTAERTASVGELLGGGREVQLPGEPLARLTVRELQIVRLLAGGRSNAEIAGDLFLSTRTVTTHVSNALRKTGCANRTQLAILSLRGHVRDGPATAAVRMDTYLDADPVRIRPAGR
jgi:DNA-binding CsgD family transcriptional regulator